MLLYLIAFARLLYVLVHMHWIGLQLLIYLSQLKQLFLNV